jgi:hypothetical protein
MRDRYLFVVKGQTLMTLLIALAFGCLMAGASYYVARPRQVAEATIAIPDTAPLKAFASKYGPYRSVAPAADRHQALPGASVLPAPEPVAGSAPVAQPEVPGAPDPGWYADPSGSSAARWWDGNSWTAHVR